MICWMEDNKGNCISRNNRFIIEQQEHNFWILIDLKNNIFYKKKNNLMDCKLQAENIVFKENKGDLCNK